MSDQDISQWLDPTVATPGIVQTFFGRWGQNMPGDGESYCDPTSLVMQLYYLGANGFTQLAPHFYKGQNNPDGPAANLEKIISGFLRTTVTEGTYEIHYPVNAYLSARGIAPEQYTTKYSWHPDLDWLADALAPNVATRPTDISLTIFWVAWFSRSSESDLPSATGGGHVLAPLAVEPTEAPKRLILNNSAPSSFEDVHDVPSACQQTVHLVRVPKRWHMPPWLPGESQDYHQIKSQNKDTKDGLSFALLHGARRWWISPAALPSAQGYQPSTWQIDKPQTLDTNGGTLHVLAPLQGKGGLIKTGLGTVVLTQSNTLTGVNRVDRGVLSSTIASVAEPFGTGTFAVTGGATLQFASGGGSMTVASGSGAFVLVAGGATLAIDGAGVANVTIGSMTDGSTANLQREGFGTLAIAPGAGLAKLGVETGQQVQVVGTGGNLPPVANGIVSPFIVGQDNDPDASGAFLTYGASGFAPASTVSSLNTPITSAPTDSPYQVVNSQTIPGNTTVSLAAVEVDPAGSIFGGLATTLNVGNQTTGSIAGVILNGGQINSESLSFGDAEGVIYTGGAGGTISASITAGALTLSGPGTLTLTAGGGSANVVFMNAGTLVLADNSAFPVNEMVVYADATVVVEETTLPGRVELGNAATLSLAGGTVAAP